MEPLSLKNPNDIENSKKSENSDPISFTTPVTPLPSKEESPEKNSPPFPADSPAYNPSSPPFPADSPAYNPSSPPFPTNSPAYNPSSPPFPTNSPAYNPSSPPFPANSPAYNPNSPPYNPSSPPYNPYKKPGDDSPQYVPRKANSNEYIQYANQGENSPEFAKESPISTPRTPEGLPPPLAPKTPELPIEKKRKQSKKIMDIYSRTLVSKKVSVEMKYIGNNIKEILEKRLKELHEGKCIAEGYVKKNSIKIITYSSGKICTSGVLYEIAFECYVCFPVEGQLLNCIATNITKAGIKATSLESPSPFVVFISRDHQLSNKKFNTISEKDHFVARIIGQRFELNDPYISVIAEIDEKKRYIKNI
jgi:hypothetical protein